MVPPEPEVLYLPVIQKMIRRLIDLEDKYNASQSNRVFHLYTIDNVEEATESNVEAVEKVLLYLHKSGIATMDPIGEGELYRLERNPNTGKQVTWSYSISTAIQLPIELRALQKPSLNADLKGPTIYDNGSYVTLANLHGKIDIRTDTKMAEVLIAASTSGPITFRSIQIDEHLAEKGIIPFPNKDLIKSYERAARGVAQLAKSIQIEQLFVVTKNTITIPAPGIINVT